MDDLKEARALWTSADALLGFCKGSSSGYVSHLADPKSHPGTGSGLFVAEGKVFASSFRPRGSVWPENHPNIGVSFKSGKWSGEQAAALQRNSPYDADDLTIALDLQTGKTLWQAVEESRGVNRYSGKRLHFTVTPAYHGGRVFSLGTMGVRYCYDAASGKKLWEDATGLLAREMPAVKEKLLRDRKDMASGGGMGASLVVADGVLVVPEFDLKGAPDIGLRGVEAASGRTLWVLPAATCRFATPAVWTHQGRQFLLCATVGQPGKFNTGQLHLIDPKTGKARWTVTGLAPAYYPRSPSATRVCVNVPSAVPSAKQSKDGLPWGLLAAFRLTPERAERAWTMPDQPPCVADTPLEVMRQAVEKEPDRPSTYNARADRDLETICLKCSEKDPRRRYSTAEALADERDRWRAGEPIHARPVTTGERVIKWARRKPALAAVAGATALAVVVGVCGIFWQWRAAEAARLNALDKAASETKAKLAAQRAEGVAKEERKRATDERDRADAAAKRFQRLLYISDMNLAKRAWDDLRIGRVVELLESHRPQPGWPDLRNFEWFYLDRLCHGELLMMKGHTGPVLSVAFSADGKELASCADDGTVRVWDATSRQETPR